MEPPKNIVKIAVQMMGAYPQLIELNQSKPLSAVLKDVCDAWNINNSEQYALQYVDGHQAYITELDKEASSLCNGVQSQNQDVRSESLKKLAAFSADVTFAQEFISRDGLRILATTVEEQKEGDVMCYTLKAIAELMEHGFVSWETFSISFIHKVVTFVNMNLMMVEITQLALVILENVLQSNTKLGAMVKQEVPLERLLTLLQLPNQPLQIKVMALIVALLQKAGNRERADMLDFLWKKNMRQFIHKEQRQQLQNLRLTAFPNEGDEDGRMTVDRRHSLCAREFHKLGFTNNGSPWQDLALTPPGLLALENMAYFSTRFPSAYNRFVLENSSREDKHVCPFARSSIHLTLVLCDILRVRETGSQDLPHHSVFSFLVSSVSL
ncbi:hypothetical protein AB205_0021070 [Aquarana catesbeiana]|uniref:ELMO domain-containing protein n=1 Tax=Aquarana catesbeiana TaxID=8400 RepID=A0A2G9SB31_AQUCT|nr:hypothetical protein AB205_0021070 [Aquarana catesbeiana]PIO37398.1 hypothetical protein AB205_0021070 [Aquarana catesbeiana]